MNPTIALGETFSIGGNDLLMLDAVGWNVFLVQEPVSLTLAGTGIAVAGLRERMRALGQARPAIACLGCRPVG